VTARSFGDSTCLPFQQLKVQPRRDDYRTPSESCSSDLSLPRLVASSLKRAERIGTERASASTRSWYRLLSSLQTLFSMNLNAKPDLEGAAPRCRLCSWFCTRVRGGWFCDGCEPPFQHRPLSIEDTLADRNATSTDTMSRDESSSMQEMDVQVSTGSHSINAGDRDRIPSQVYCSYASSLTRNHTDKCSITWIATWLAMRARLKTMKTLCPWSRISLLPREVVTGTKLLLSSTVVALMAR
jgi:hypothetical protein